MQDSRILIVEAFPEQRSFTAALSATANAYFSACGSEVLTSNLYAMEFNPVASEADFTSRTNVDYLVYALEQRHAWQNRTIAQDIQREVEKLLWCDFLVLAFPLYWFSVPAMLKGWFDRVLLSGLTYGGRRFYDRAPLRGKRAMVLMTTGSRAHMLTREGIHRDIANVLWPIHTGTLQYVGIDVLPPFIAYHVPYIDAERRSQYLESLSRHLSSLKSMAPLEMPSLGGYDASMRPLNINE